MKRLRFCLLFMLIISHYLLAQSPVESANEAYIAGDYSSAISEYEAILAEGNESADLHYNLGNAYFRKGSIGKAVLHLEKAKQFNPRDKDILHNLDIVKKSTVDQFEVIPVFFMSQWLQNIQKLLSPNAWAILGLLFLWAGVFGLILMFRGKDRKIRKQGFIVGSILLLICILPLSLGFSSARQLNDSERGVLINKVSTMKSAPDPESETILELHEGTSFNILDEIGTWKKIHLSNGEEGWIESNTFEKI